MCQCGTANKKRVSISYLNSAIKYISYAISDTQEKKTEQAEYNIQQAINILTDTLEVK